MIARTLRITGRRHDSPNAFASLADFDVDEGPPIDPRAVLAPAVSLYSIDPATRCAIFVETPRPGALYAEAFLYQAQRRDAVRLIAVPYDVVHELARGVAFDPRGLIVIYSVGRCGSTLVSRVFHHATAVASLSEPDVHTQLVARPDPALLRSCTVLACDAATRATGRTRWAIKLRSFGIELAQSMARCFPEARAVFLVRELATWLRSAGRAYGLFDPAAPAGMAELHTRLAPLVPRLADLGRIASPVELLCCLWMSTVERALDAIRAGVPLNVTRYEHMIAAPRATLEALLAVCGVTFDVSALERVLAFDSQEGTHLARDALRDAHDMTVEHRREVQRLAAGECDDLHRRLQAVCAAAAGAKIQGPADGPG